MKSYKEFINESSSFSINKDEKLAATKVEKWINTLPNKTKISIQRGNYKFSDKIEKDGRNFCYGRHCGTCQEIILLIFQVGAGSSEFTFTNS